MIYTKDKDYYLKVRMSADDMALLVNCAENYGISVSQYVRNALSTYILTDEYKKVLESDV